MNTEPTQDNTSITVSVEPTSISTNGSESEVKAETAALIDAIKKRAQAEILAAGDLTRETYLNAVRQAKEAIEQDKLIDRDRIEESIHHLQKEAEKNWTSVRTEIEQFGNRLSEAAKTAWDTLTQPKEP